MVSHIAIEVAVVGGGVLVGWLMGELSQGVRKKKTPYMGLFYFNKVSWTPSPRLPKMEINHVF